MKYFLVLELRSIETQLLLTLINYMSYAYVTVKRDKLKYLYGKGEHTHNYSMVC